MNARDKIEKRIYDGHGYLSVACRITPLIAILLFATPGAARAQVQLGRSVYVSGTVTDVETKFPIAGVHIFYSSTTIGDATDESGRFELPPPPVETIDVVFSMLGYETLTFHIDLAIRAVYNLDVRMTPSVVQLDGVTVTEIRGEEWYENVRRFEEIFFSRTEFGGSCELLNPTVIAVQYDELQDYLTVSVASPLIVVNRDLGYRISFHNLSLESRGDSYRWYAEPLFEVMQPQGESQANKWKRNRQEAYEGSLTHLLRTMISGRLIMEGFDVYNVALPEEYSLRSPIPGSKVDTRYATSTPAKPVLFSGERPGTFELQFSGSLLIVYTKDREPTAYSGSQSFAQYQTSWLALPDGIAHVDTNGNLLLREQRYPITLYGYLGWERVGELLPLDYDPIQDGSE